MDHDGIPANVVTYNSVAWVWLRVLFLSYQQTDTSCKLQYIMSFLFANGNLTANVKFPTTRTQVINACARCGDATRAEYWFQKMTAQGVQPGVLTFNSMAGGVRKAVGGCTYYLGSLGITRQ